MSDTIYIRAWFNKTHSRSDCFVISRDTWQEILKHAEQWAKMNKAILEELHLEEE